MKLTTLMTRRPKTTATATVLAPSHVTLAEIDDAARAYTDAADVARAAERAKRGARKLLDTLPAGRYGLWRVERVPSGRETVDLDAVRRAYAAHGLGPLPMKPIAPSLSVTRERAEQ